LPPGGLGLRLKKRVLHPGARVVAIDVGGDDVEVAREDDGPALLEQALRVTFY